MHYYCPSGRHYQVGALISIQRNRRVMAGFRAKSDQAFNHSHREVTEKFGTD